MDDLGGINFLIYRHNDVIKCAPAGFHSNSEYHSRKYSKLKGG
jgi:hypothetical protein